ncbi:unnamed protein product [Lactuca saligna]|uniref:Uncharacterized protein n=1 Tax=Lactuca saligna TaxID=75948 RepID=A0AA35VVI0_LACSI|nr:unnamed protein product [Lactuca saligna]
MNIIGLHRGPLMSSQDAVTCTPTAACCFPAITGLLFPPNPLRRPTTLHHRSSHCRSPAPSNLSTTASGNGCVFEIDFIPGLISEIKFLNQIVKGLESSSVGSGGAIDPTEAYLHRETSTADNDTKIPDCRYSCGDIWSNLGVFLCKKILVAITADHW